MSFGQGTRHAPVSPLRKKTERETLDNRDIREI